MINQRHVISFLPVTRIKCQLNGLFTQITCYSHSKQTAKYIKPHKRKGVIDRPRHFVDYVEVMVKGGNGGNGMMSLSSLPNLEWAGPDGGNGGNGGHVIFKVSHNAKSLAHLKPVIIAPKGTGGKSRQRDGKNAPNLTIQVPFGTVIKSKTGQTLTSLDEADAMFIAARGGAGGKGNYYFLSNENRAPTMAEKGGQGQERELLVELKTMAHAGLIGFPNAGKSSLLQAISRAQPKVSPYPFTTLSAHIGMVLYDDYEQLAVADIPGLIPGSHLNKGMGHSFLRHVERCLCLVYVIDLALEKPWQQLQQLQYELNQYKPGLADRPALLVGNKIDLPGAQGRMDKLKEWMKNERINKKAIKVKVNENECETITREEEVLGPNGFESSNKIKIHSCHFGVNITDKLENQKNIRDLNSHISGVDFDLNEKNENVQKQTNTHDMLRKCQDVSQKHNFNNYTDGSGVVGNEDSSVDMQNLVVSAKCGIGINEFLHHLRIIYDSHLSSRSNNKPF